MFIRELNHYFHYVVEKFPVVTLTGPRQSGKTFLVRHLFPQKSYVSLEDLDNRSFALNDPRGFLNTYSNGVIIDEAQYAPDLFSYIQTRVDESQQMGEYILTGSQQFLLMERISQSLAGRAAVLQLLPLSLSELTTEAPRQPFDAIFQGFYPAVHARKIDPTTYYKSYLNTYVERDVRSLKNISNLMQFRNFMSLCAGRVGQLVNMSELGNEIGITQQTAKAWLALLEASYILFLLKPHFQNFNKRLTKQSKLYFYDTGLACHLLGITTPSVLATHYSRGALFENFVALELIKSQTHKGLEPHLYFWRDHHGHEIDFLADRCGKILPIEVKSASTLHPGFFEGLAYWQQLAQQTDPGFLVYAGEEKQERTATKVIPWNLCAEIG